MGGHYQIKDIKNLNANTFLSGISRQTSHLLDGLRFGMGVPMDDGNIASKSYNCGFVTNNIAAKILTSSKII